MTRMHAAPPSLRGGVKESRRNRTRAGIIVSTSTPCAVSKTLLVGPSSLAQQRTALDGENGDERINTASAVRQDGASDISENFIRLS